MDWPDLEQQVTAIATLAEPVRRALYLYVISRPTAVSRDEAAQAVGISRSLAAFHLDRLATVGLLDVSYRRLTNRTGPGAGRPAKLYRRIQRTFELSLPPRRYEFLAHLFALTLEQTLPPSSQALEETAHGIGIKLGAQARENIDPEASRDVLLTTAETLLAAYGFQPCRATNSTLLLCNCPFDRLAKEHRELVCGMNLALIRGLLEGLRLEGIETEFFPQPDMCCVLIRGLGSPTSSQYHEYRAAI
jgi:predicted ArsR family transcriptional regulator